jgi:hypothetical protein
VRPRSSITRVCGDYCTEEIHGEHEHLDLGRFEFELGAALPESSLFFDGAAPEPVDGLRIRQDLLLGTSKHTSAPRILRLSHPELNRFPCREAGLPRLSQPSSPRPTGVETDSSGATPGTEISGVQIGGRKK